MSTALLLASAIFVLLTLLPLSRFPQWWVRMWDFPRLQLFLVGLALLLAQLIWLPLTQTGVLLAFGATLLSVLYQAWWIFPYTPLFPREVQSADIERGEATLRIVAANVKTPNRNAEGLLQQVRAADPHILVALETDAWWESQLDSLEERYPFTIKCPRDNLYGMHVYSRLPLEESEIQYLVEPDVPSMHALVRLPCGAGVRAHFLHPAPPSPTENEESSERDAELIIVARSVADADVPVVVAGDLNDVAWSKTTRLFRKLSGLLDPRVGRGMFNTFHAEHFFIRWPLDHLFHSDHFRLSRLQRLQPFGSDHFPLLTELVYQPSATLLQEGLDADADDIALAREKAAGLGANKSDVPQPEKNVRQSPQAGRVRGH